RYTLGGREINESKLAQLPSATNAGTVVGLGPDAFLSTTGKAADSNRLDGLDSSAFVATAKPGVGTLVGEPWHEVGAPGEPQFDAESGSLPGNYVISIRPPTGLNSGDTIVLDGIAFRAAQ